MAIVDCLNFMFEDGNGDPNIEESPNLSFKISKLTNNQFHHFLDCDKCNSKDVELKSHDFGFLVKPSPFQQLSSTLPDKETNTIEVRSTGSSLNLENDDESFFLFNKNIRRQSKRKSALPDYHPKHKTFPHGILKSGQKCKYSHHAPIALENHEGDELKFSEWKSGWDDLENVKTSDKPKSFILKNSK